MRRLASSLGGWQHLVAGAAGAQTRWCAQKPALEKVQAETDPAPTENDSTEPDPHPTYATDEEWEDIRMQMSGKHGEGTYSFYRAMYKDFCDEMRREMHAKPPAPYAPGWRIDHKPGTNFVVFVREQTEEDKAKGIGKVFAYADVKIGDPSRINELMTFVNWWPIDVLIIRDGVCMQVSLGNVESQFHIRNMKIYPDDGKLAQYNDEANYVRDKLTYNGPYWGHLEADVASELHDTIFDHGINPETSKYFADWINYFEHVEYTRWGLTMLNTILPEGVEKEEQLLTRSEKQELDIAADEWLPLREM
jgi:hypothetical protein